MSLRSDPLSALQQALDDGQEIEDAPVLRIRERSRMNTSFASTATATSKPSTWTL